MRLTLNLIRMYCFVQVISAGDGTLVERCADTR
jgi:hypothetical protein